MHERIIACASASSARAHYSPRERIKCTSALLPARAHQVHERIIACASASSARAHYCLHQRKSLPITQFNWTTRTHCTNTTYLLSLDTIRCTSTTLHMNSLLHLCTSICCSTNLLLIYNLLHLTLLLCIDYIMYR